MATIKLKKSSVAGRVPGISDLSYGEVALNFTDGKIYYKNSSNEIKGFIDSAGVDNAISSAISSLTTGDIPEGSSLYYTSARFDSDLGKSSSISSIRGYFSAGGDLSYNSSTGQFSFDVENVYTQANFDSDFNTSLDAAALGGTGLTYVGSTNTLNITNTGVVGQGYGDSSRIPVFTVNDQGQLTYAKEVRYPGVSSLGYDSATGQITIGTIDSQTFAATVTLNPFTTTDLTEGNNLYYTRTRFDSDLGSVVGPPNGLEYTSGQLKIRSSGVTPGVYGSASLIPVLSITDQGRIDSAGTIAVAGVSSTAFDSSNYTFDINTADGGTYSEMIHTKMPGTAGTYGSASQVPIITVNEFGHVDSISTTSVAGVSSTSWDSASGVLTINTSDGASYSERILEQELGPNNDVSFKSVQFYTGDSHLPYSEGLVWYDNIHKTINYYSDDSNVVHELGIEEHQRVYNNTGATILKGQPLYFSGNYIDPNGTGVPTVGKADATDVNAYNAQGLAASDIADGEYGFCIIAGQLHDVDTSHLNAGTNFFVGLGPGLTQNASPTYPNYPMCLGWVVRADSSEGILLVNQQNHSANSFRVRTSAHIGTDLQVDGNLTVLGSQVIASSENISIGGAFNYFNAGDTIGEANTIFVGSGLDDAYFAGHYNGDSASKQFYVKIDATGTPDTFEWGHDSASPIATGIAITGSEQDLTLGIKINFGTTTGHTSGDKWTGSASPTNVDTGWISNRNTGTSGIGYTHLGVFYDVTDNAFKFFDRYDPEPEGTINTADSTFELATISAGTFDGNLAWANVTNKPDPTITLNLTGDVTGSASTTLTDLASGTINLATSANYYTGFDSDFSSKSTTDLTEGTNLYYTQARVDSDITALVDSSFVSSLQAATEINALTDGYYDSTNEILSLGYRSLGLGASDNATCIGRWNTSFGIEAGHSCAANTGNSGSCNTSIGYHAGRCNSSLTWMNTYVGHKAGCAAGNYASTYVGQEAGRNGSGAYNTIIGKSAGCAASGGWNTSVGAYSMANIATAFAYNTAMGYEAARFLTSGCENVAVGRYAMCSGVENYCNIFIGACAGRLASTAYNIGLGKNALCNTYAAGNIGIGQFSLQQNTTGCLNVAVGDCSLQNNSTGCFNTAVGHRAGILTTTGTCNSFFGMCSGYGNTTGSGNTAIGYNALYSNSAGSCNIAIGECAAYNQTTGCQIVAIGFQALQCNTNGRWNTAVGHCALSSNINNDRNVAVGSFAGQNNTTGNYNVTVGMNAGRYNTTGRCNTAVGNAALYSSGYGGCSVAIGYLALYSNTIGDGNTSLGFCSARSNTTGGCNVVVGYCAGVCGTTTRYNVALGACSMIGTNGDFNVGIGYETFCAVGGTGGRNVGVGAWSTTAITSGYYNAGIGICSNKNVTTAYGNTALGTWTLTGNTTGSYNTAAGFQSMISHSGSCNVAAGYQSMQNSGEGSCNVALGARAGTCISTGSANTIMGYHAFDKATGASNNVVIGDSAGTILLDGNDNSNVIIGSCALSNSPYLDSASLDIVNNVVIGALAGRCMAKGCNVAIGYSAYSNNVTGCRSTVVGFCAMTCATTGRDNVAIGYKALDQWTGECNTAIGSNSMRFSAETGTVMGICNTALGSGAAYCMQDGCRNTFIGANSGWIASSRGGAYANTFIGGGSGWRVNGDFNAGIGWEVGLNLDSGACNTLLGTTAGYGLTTGSLNTFAGAFTGCGITTGTNNILIGANVGRNTGSFALDLDSATSNAIVIGNNGSKSFDIYNLSFNIDSNGETNAVDFNTTSDLSLKDNIEAINNGIDIVNKINPVSFNWKSSGKKAYGVIAQEIEEVIPEIVSKNSKGNKTVSYSQIIAFLVDAVKQQQKDIEELKSKIK